MSQSRRKSGAPKSHRRDAVGETVNVTADFLPNLERENRNRARAQERDDRLHLREIVRAQLRLIFKRPPQIRASARTEEKTTQTVMEQVALLSQGLGPPPSSLPAGAAG